MVLTLHTVIALASLVISGWTFMRPSEGRVKVSYGFIGGTIVTGTLLVLTTQASILRACVTGLAFVSVTTALTVLANKKLSSAK